MTASLLFRLGWLLVAGLLGCAPQRDTSDTRSARVARHDDASAGALVAAQGEILADGSCRVLVNGASLFTAGDAARASYDSGAVADVAPAGYALHQLACAPAGADPALPPDRGDERMVIITLYVRNGASLRPGRYVVRAGLAEGGDTAGVASRAGIAIFGARTATGAAASGAGVRYLEARDGALDLAAVDGVHVVGRFDVHAGEGWSM